jgi:zinc protease
MYTSRPSHPTAPEAIPVIRLLFLLAFCLGSGLVYAGPTIQHWTTSNGARVYFVPAPGLPMVDVRLAFDAGSARDGEQPGLAQLCNSLLDDGTGELDADQIATRFEQVGARFSTTTYRDMAIVDLRSLSEAGMLRTAARTTAQLLASPSFPPEALERERQRALVALQERQQSPDAIADDAFMAAVYKGHPYASPTAGTVAGVNGISREDLANFHARYYVGHTATVAIVGDLDRAAAEDLAWVLVKDLKSGRAAPLLPPIATPPNGYVDQRTLRIDYPSSQTHILIGQPGISRDDPDYFPLYVGNHVLGGSGLVSRISEEIREKRGLSYSAYSYFTPMRQRGPFTIGLQTRNDQADEALQVARKTLRQFIDDGPTATELKESKQNITGGFPLRLSSNKKIVGMLAMIGFYQLPLDYLDTFTTRVEAVTLKDIRDAFARRIHPDSMITVLVGDQSKSD